MRYLLWLDDDTEYRNPESLCPNFGMMYTWKECFFSKDVQELPILWAHNYKEFVLIIIEKHVTTGYMPVEISFDNDLGEKLEGYDCAKWLVDYCMVNGLTLPNYTVHSANPVARENIISYLENFKKYE